MGHQVSVLDQRIRSRDRTPCSQKKGSLDVLAFAPAHIKNVWHVNTGHGPFVPDPNVKLVTGARMCGVRRASQRAVSNGQVLTNLGAWAIDPAAEVALKVTKEGLLPHAPRAR